MSELLALFVSYVFLFRELSQGSLSLSTQSSKGKEKHAVHEHSWQLKFVTWKIKKHSQVKEDKGTEAGMGEMGTPRLDGWVGREVDTVQVWYLSLWRRTTSTSFLLGQTCPIALGVGGIVGSGMYPL